MLAFLRVYVAQSKTAPSSPDSSSNLLPLQAKKGQPPEAAIERQHVTAKHFAQHFSLLRILLCCCIGGDPPRTYTGTGILIDAMLLLMYMVRARIKCNRQTKTHQTQKKATFRQFLPATCHLCQSIES